MFFFQTPTMTKLMDGPTSTPNASFHMISRSFYATLAKEKHIHNGKLRLGSKLWTIAWTSFISRTSPEQGLNYNKFNKGV